MTEPAAPPARPVPYFEDSNGVKWVQDPAGQWHLYIKQPLTAPVLVALWVALVVLVVVLNITNT